MKDSLIEQPPTIADLKRQGVAALRVTCQRPCKRVGRIPFAALRLPENTIIKQIPKLRRLRCEACDRCLPDLSPIWPVPADALPKIDAPSARWIVVVVDAEGVRGISTPLWSRSHASPFARRQIAQGYALVRIETAGSPLSPASAKN